MTAEIICAELLFNEGLYALGGVTCRRRLSLAYCTIEFFWWAIRVILHQSFVPSSNDLLTDDGVPLALNYNEYLLENSLRVNTAHGPA